VAAPESEEPKKATIADEIAALDRARRSLDSGNPTRALLQLDTYSKLFPGGRLGQEAIVMRIRALVHAGRSPEAKSLARRFRSANPQSPYNKRIDSIVAPRDGR
jgi:outer membrane protein assembly factor BamD (BamD/ComL family)